MRVRTTGMRTSVNFRTNESNSSNFTLKCPQLYLLFDGCSTHLTSNKLSPTRPTNSWLPFLSMILAACSAFLIEVKSNAAMSGCLLPTILSSKFFSVPLVAYLTTSVTYSSSLEWSMLQGARSLAGCPRSCVKNTNQWNACDKPIAVVQHDSPEISWHFHSAIYERIKGLFSMNLFSVTVLKRH